MANSVWIGPFGIQFNGSATTFSFPVLLSDGTAALPSLAFATDPLAGWFAQNTGVWGLTYHNTGVATFNPASSNGLRISSNMGFSWSSGDTNTVGADTFLLRASAGNISLGGATAAWNIGAAGIVDQGAHTITAGGLITGGALASTGKLTSYNGISTAGWGVPAIQGAAVPLTAQVAAVASVTAYTVGAADGSFDVSANVNVTASATHAFGVVITYTDETNTPRSLTLPMAQLAGTFVASITNVTGAGPYEGATVTVRAKAGTAITVTTAGTFTSVTYNVSGTIKQVA